MNFPAHAEFSLSFKLLFYHLAHYWLVMARKIDAFRQCTDDGCVRSVRVCETGASGSVVNTFFTQTFLLLYFADSLFGRRLVCSEALDLPSNEECNAADPQASPHTCQRP